jgi:hypothetical protein
MVEIDKAVVGNEENTTPSLTPHQKYHYVLYYLDIVSNHLEMYNLGIISTFSTLRR